jgi:hypothetical protein
MIQRAQANAQSWANLLSGSGGAFEPSKCFTYIVAHEWKTGRPSLKATRHRHQSHLERLYHPPALHCRMRRPSQRHMLPGYPAWLALSGTSDTEYLHRYGQAKLFAHSMISAQFSRAAADLALRSIIQPAMEYPLGIVHFSQTT